jgi:hypothetical protein
MNDILTYIAPITALVAVILGPTISIYIARRQIRGSVVSANRQAWSISLRDTLASYMAKQSMARNLNKLHYADQDSLARIEEIVGLQYKIELLLNPTQKDHAELIELLSNVTRTVNQQKDANKDFDIDSCNARIVRLSQMILKLEWERVKQIK